MKPLHSTVNRYREVPEWKTKFPGLTAVFSTKNGGVSKGAYASLNTGLHVSDDEQDVIENRRLLGESAGAPLEKWVLADQVHGSRVARAEQTDRGKGAFRYADSIPATDGLWTTDKETFLSLCFADCVPILFVDGQTGFTGAAHAGWKGTVANIAGEMITAAEEAGVDTGDLHVWIGPSIGQARYQVNDHVLDQVKNVCGDQAARFYTETEPGQYLLDLKSINAYLLKQAGVKQEHITVSDECTYEESDRYFSHRRDNGKTGRMMAVIGWKE